jgi:hypothetical protein
MMFFITVSRNLFLVVRSFEKVEGFLTGKGEGLSFHRVVLSVALALVVLNHEAYILIGGYENV